MMTSPGLSFAFTVANAIVVMGSLVMATYVLPRLTVRKNITLYAGIAFWTLNAAQHLDVTLGLLFANDFAEVGRSWHLLALRLGTALALALFVGGIFLDVAEWRRLRSTPPDEERPS